MVLGEEDVIGILRVDEASPQALDLALEELRLEQLVRESNEAEVEEGRDDAVFESGRLREPVPEAVEVGRERRLKIRERSSADVVTDDEKEESFVLRAAKGVNAGAGRGVATMYVPTILPLSFAARNKARLTSKTVLRSPMLAPW